MYPMDSGARRQQVHEKRIWTSLPSSLRMAWKGVLKPRHFLGVRLAVMTMSWISSSDIRSMESRGERHTRFAFVEDEHGPGALADDEVAFPMANVGAGFDVFRSIVDRGAVFDRIAGGLARRGLRRL